MWVRGWGGMRGFREKDKAEKGWVQRKGHAVKGVMARGGRLELPCPSGAVMLAGVWLEGGEGLGGGVEFEGG